ncbi:lipase-like protein [Trypanosoma rangeli]|uniref:Lipase-like protein n=1 Tax=Trypanosoma rangeli TaxID=5698 RepID=A0A422N960_TRYRA|nr:lipase-like protein [Trypanosoma rangeli]RNF02019.1 lipase-like protein [Trypanosoma rangeli]|eukprot:RNF02019.1 lipase-like protein [Trypanosoma rangeli]
MQVPLLTRARSLASSVTEKLRVFPGDVIWPFFLLTGEYAHVCVIAYRTFIHFRLRQALRVIFGVPVSGVALYMAHAAWAWYPEPAAAIDTSSVAGCRPVFRSTAELLDFASTCSRRYHRLFEEGDDMSSACLNELVGDMLTILRSIEAIEGSFEERELVTASLTVTDPSRGVEQEASPAEAVLRVVLLISLDQGWFDIVEEARKMYSNLVRERPVPLQANVTSAVADLCALSYELESCASSAEVTMPQRQRVARAIDAFRPGSSVRERCTIAAEIGVLPLVDLDRTTRCLMLTRRSPGRRPQLIITFVGSNSVRNWWRNLRCDLTELPAAFGVQACVHKGFLQLLQSVAFEEVAAGFDQIILIGHSMGGALAQLAGLYLANERPERRVTVLTVASPRVLSSPRGVWRRGADWIRGRGAAGREALIALPSNFRHIRAFMCADVVPRLPPAFLGYQHVGTPLPLHTGCPTRMSYLGWGLWSCLFHTADMYKAVLERPAVAQLHRYDYALASSTH